MADWNTGLFDCCDDARSCCFGCCCCPCLACTVSEMYGENRCLPLCDIFSPAVASCGLPLFVPPAGLTLRVGIRHKYGIKGNFCKDIAISCFCICCSWCQMHRELKLQQKKPAVVVNVQPAPVVHGKPPEAGFVSQSGVVVTTY